MSVSPLSLKEVSFGLLNISIHKNKKLKVCKVKYQLLNTVDLNVKIAQNM